MAVSRRDFVTWTGAVVAAAAVDFGGLVTPVLSTPAFAATTSTPGRGLFGGLTTLDQTVIRPPSDATVRHGYVTLLQGAGEGHVVRDDLVPAPGFEDFDQHRLYRVHSRVLLTCGGTR
jgi:hypothetical protein